MPQKWELPEDSPSHRTPDRKTLAAISMATGIRTEWLETGEGSPRDPRKAEVARMIQALVQEHGFTDDDGNMVGGEVALWQRTDVPMETWKKWTRTGPRNIGEAEALERALHHLRETSSSDAAIRTIDRIMDPSTGSGGFVARTPRVLATLKAEKKDAAGDDTIAIPIYDIHAAAGPGYANGPVTVSSEIRLSPAFIRQALHVPHEALAVILIKGDSMVPTLHPGDAVFVDTRTPESIPDGIYLLRQDESLMVKQVQRLPGGALQISSRNTAYPPYLITAENCQGFKVVGRVVGKCGRI